MKKRWEPDFLLKSFNDITKEWLEENNITTILSDLDSTLAPHNEMPGREFEPWQEMLQEAECSLIIISNNDRHRVEEFVKQYKVVGIADCKKPGTKKIENELVYRGLDLDGVVLLGDQLFTDVWCGKKIGVKTALVEPVEGAEPLQIRFKRMIEKLVIKR